MKQEQIEKILEEHKAWLNRTGGAKADLHGADLCGANLCDANLYGANLCDANLRDADLYGADLRDANPVSYTHLDVYKRQAGNGGMARHLSACGVCAASHIGVAFDFCNKGNER